MLSFLERVKEESTWTPANLKQWFSGRFLQRVPAESVLERLTGLSSWGLRESHCSDLEGLFVFETHDGPRLVIADIEKAPPHRFERFAIRAPQRYWYWDEVREKLREVGRVDRLGDKNLHALVEDFIEEQRVCGLTMSLSRVDDVVHSQTFGSGNLDHFSPLTRETVMRVGSIAKVITTIGILKLVDEGKVALDDPAEDYLDSFKIVSHHKGPLITLRHLLSHASGLPRSKGDPTTASSVSQMVGGEVRASRAAGKTHLYSNLGFATLGQIVEDITGQPFADWTKANVLEPLGMKRAIFAGSGADPALEGYERYGRMIVPTKNMSIIEHAAGALCASVEDLEKLSLGVINQSLVDKELWTEALTPQEPEDGSHPLPEAAKPAGYRTGLGFNLLGMGREQVVGHNGTLAGWNAIWACIPAVGLGVAIASNTFPLALEKLAVAMLRWGLDQ